MTAALRFAGIVLVGAGDDRTGDEIAAAAGRGQVRVSSTARPPRRAAGVQPRRPVNRGVKRGACGLITPAILAVAAGVADLSGSDAVGGVAVMTAMTIAFLYFVLWLFVGADLLGQWREERSRRQSPPRSAQGAGGQPSQRPAAASADQLFQARAATLRSSVTGGKAVGLNSRTASWPGGPATPRTSDGSWQDCQVPG